MIQPRLKVIAYFRRSVTGRDSLSVTQAVIAAVGDLSAEIRRVLG